MRRDSGGHFYVDRDTGRQMKPNSEWGGVKSGETSSTGRGKEFHTEQADIRRESGQFSSVDEVIRDQQGNIIKVPRKVDLKDGTPRPGKSKTARPDATIYERGLVIDDKPLGRDIMKDRQQMIRYIEAFKKRMGRYPKTIAIQRYDNGGVPVQTDLYKPSDFLPRKN